MKVFVELLGWFHQACDRKIWTIDVNREINIIELFQELRAELVFDTKTMVSDALILVNEREISVLNGLETSLSNGDKVIIIPVSHGG